MRYDMVQGDLEPLGLELDGVSSLAGATVTFAMQQAGGSKRVTGPIVVDDPVARLVRYVWLPGETDVPGVYRAQITSMTDGVPETWPSDEDLFIIIRPRV